MNCSRLLKSRRSPVAIASQAVCAGLVVATLGNPPQSKPPAKRATHQVFVRVLDRSGAPILDLQPADFEIVEEGVKREVVRATPMSKIPMRVLLLADTSEHAAPALLQLRNALVAFLDALPPEHEAAIVTMDRRPSVRVGPTTDRKKLKNTASGLFTDGAGTAVIDALLESDDRFIKSVDDRWPVFVVVTSDGNESSTGVDENGLNAWLGALPARGISAHAITLKFKGTGLGEAVAQTATRNAGGRYDFINSPNSLSEKMKTLAERIAKDFEQGATKYQVDFVTDSKDWKKVEISVARDGARLEISQGRLR